MQVAATHSACVKPYEEALTTFYCLKMQEIVHSPARAVETPDLLTLSILDHKIGQLLARAYIRFQIEVFFLRP